MARRIQALVVLLSVLPCLAAGANDRDGLTARLRGECDALLRMAVHKPYGLAWPAPDGHDVSLPRGASLVSFERESTPSAGLVLLRAGKSLNEQRYVTAAHQAARGIAASLHPTGRVPSRAVFDTRSRPRDGTIAFPDRGPTYAGLALMLTVTDEGNDDTLIRSAAARAATFLTRQQTGTGAWPVVSSADADAKESAANRTIPLHDTDYRDGTLALLYAYEVFGDVPLRKAVESATKHLIDLRIKRSKSAAGLWHGEYNLSAQPLARSDGNLAVDTLASRHALHTLFAVHVILGGDSTQLAIEESANRLVALRYDNGQWDRLYPLKDNEVQKKPGGPDPGPLFTDPDAPAQPNGDFGIPPLLNSVGQMQQKGRAAYLDQLSKHLTPKQRLAQALCGLYDSPLLLSLPTTAEEAKAYAAAHHDEWQALDSPSVANVHTRIRRIHALLNRRHVEPLLNPPPAAAAPGNGSD